MNKSKPSDRHATMLLFIDVSPLCFNSIVMSNAEICIYTAVGVGKVVILISDNNTI
jgi:hypothetical protein